MAHGKRNNTAAFFTPHERAELRSTWGSRSTRLTRESFLPFGSCNLCLLPARDPVSCSEQGHLFCRECAVTNLLAQSQEIKRLKKEAERRQAEIEEEQSMEIAELQAKTVQDFESTQAGLDGSDRKRKRDSVDWSAKRQAIDANDATSFWVPSQRPSEKPREIKASKRHPTCPITTNETTHDFSLKAMVEVKFREESSKDGSKEKVKSCPSCNKALSNATKAVLARPCGHVLCRSCSDKFQKMPEDEQQSDQTIQCYVCQTDITPGAASSAGEGKEKKGKTQRGLIELKSDGTGFAGGGNNMVKKQGLAFQVG